MSENIVAIERTPEVIAFEIRTLSNQFQHLRLSYAIEIGRKLREAKDLVSHGEWGNWLKDNTEFKQSTAENLMRIFKDYGADQVGLFGDSKSQTLGNLSYTKALKLLDVPEEEREEFAIEHKVDELSTRELDRIIKERDAALVKAKRIDEMTDELQRAIDDADAQRHDVVRLEVELKELRSRPIDVAVMEADPAVIDQARAEAAAAAKKKAEVELKAKIQKAQDDQKKAEDKLSALKTGHDAEVKKLKEELEKSKTSKTEQNTKELETLKIERDAALAKANEAEKKLAVAAPEMTEFKILYDEAQELFKKMFDKLEKAAPEKRDGLRKAMSTLLSICGDKLKEGAA